jgi:hypothetical protein
MARLDIKSKAVILTGFKNYGKTKLFIGGCWCNINY